MASQCAGRRRHSSLLSNICNMPAQATQHGPNALDRGARAPKSTGHKFTRPQGRELYNISSLPRGRMHLHPRRVSSATSYLRPLPPIRGRRGLLRGAIRRVLGPPPSKDRPLAPAPPGTSGPLTRSHPQGPRVPTQLEHTCPRATRDRWESLGLLPRVLGSPPS